MNNLDDFDEEELQDSCFSDLPTEHENNHFPDVTPHVLNAERAFKHFFNQNFNNSLIPYDDDQTL